MSIYVTKNGVIYIYCGKSQKKVLFLVVQPLFYAASLSQSWAIQHISYRHINTFFIFSIFNISIALPPTSPSWKKSCCLLSYQHKHKLPTLKFLAQNHGQSKLSAIEAMQLKYSTYNFLSLFIMLHVRGIICYLIVPLQQFIQGVSTSRHC